MLVSSLSDFKCTIPMIFLFCVLNVNIAGEFHFSKCIRKQNKLHDILTVWKLSFKHLKLSKRDQSTLWTYQVFWNCLVFFFFIGTLFVPMPCMWNRFQHAIQSILELSVIGRPLIPSRFKKNVRIEFYWRQILQSLKHRFQSSLIYNET